ncbi:YlbL family protein [Beutenbergia cavernae]|uniref:YlbL family protein n=1 Tax=Beutenbergia cavernae TaxID=84757 RepID=UPI00019AD68D|nr:S16 family serine protease [Beutenbergia cavernae]
MVTRTYRNIPMPRSSLSPRSVLLAASGLATFVLLAAILVVPAPYAIEQPGPTVDTLGEVDDVELITIPDAETFPSEGQLRLTTVSVAGGPGFPVDAADVVQGWLSSAVAVVPVESVYQRGVSREELQSTSQAQMTTSQENATAAALTELGYEVPTVLTVSAAVPDSGSDGVVEPGDVVTSIQAPDGPLVPTETFPDLTQVLDGVAPGSSVALGVERDGEPETLDVVTGDDGNGGSVLGVLIDPTFTFPIEVDIEIQDIGGPSAGTMFALGIIERLTPGDSTGGEIIAGTGTIDLSGEVGAIGGIVQKLHGAQRDGAGWFLAPAANCEQVVGNVPEGLQVVRVATLSDARDAVEAIGAGDTADLPSCS